MRRESADRSGLARRIGVPPDWATVNQVHGRDIAEVSAPGPAGDADGLFTLEPGVPLAVFTADCVGVAIAGDKAIGVAHAGWRGAESRVVPAILDIFDRSGIAPTHATIGPHIRRCCFEVGEEVAERFPAHTSSTTWGTTSVDLSSVIRAQLGSIPTADISRCTRCGTNTFSHRRNADLRRMATVAMLVEAT